MLLKSDVFMWNEPLERLERSELEQLQLRRLRELVGLVAFKVPHYRDALAQASVKQGDIQSLADVARLPFTTKTQLRDNYPLGCLAVDKAEVRRIHASSGTRGKPTIAAYTQNDLSTWAELVARCLVSAGAAPGDVVQNAYGYGLFTGGLGLHQGAEMVGATVVPASAGRTQQQAMLLQDLGVRVLCCTPSYALNIAATLGEANIDLSQLKLEIGILGAEPWTQECRSQVEKALRIKAYDIYGLSEVMGPGIAVECAVQDGLHVWEDHFLIEVVDPATDKPVAPGQEGELVVTTLTKEAMPLLRYRTGDVCSIIETPCDCGRSSRRITRIQGRLDDMLIIKGVNVYPSEIESVVYSLTELSPQYQIVVDRVQALDDLKIRAELLAATQAQWQTGRESPEIMRRELETRLSGALRERLGLTAMVEVLDANTLPRSEGKAHRVLDMRGT